MTRRMLLKVAAVLGMGVLARGLSLWPAAASDRHRFEITKSEEEWRAILTPQQYKVLREEWTEPPYRNQYHDHKAPGTYVCAGCELPLFSSATKYDSRTGWPSFWEPLRPSVVGTRTDFKLIYPRTEVHCARCGGHLGHIFDDGPPPTGLRYCINSAALKFVPTA